jgi:ATP-binding cassette subfamily C (CFTR/MRP) protein 1
VNAVERVLWYANRSSLPQEKPHLDTNSEPAQTWPAKGCVAFQNVEMAYRPGLPTVLKGMWVIHLVARSRYSTFATAGGEKIGIVGRTGAGKTSLTVALFRLAE